MGIVCFAFCASLLAATVAGLAVFALGKRLHYRTLGVIAGAAAGTVILVLLFPRLLYWIDAATTITKLGVDPASCGVLREFDLPVESVHDFCYQICMRSVSPRADFEMSEADFLQWMKSKGYEPQEFQMTDGMSLVELSGRNRKENGATLMDASVFPLRSGGARLVVKDGYCVYDQDGRSIFTFVYDRHGKRVYFEHAVL